MDIDPVDFLPQCDRYPFMWNLTPRSRRPSILLTICSHFLTIVISVMICTGTFYYYTNYYPYSGNNCTKGLKSQYLKSLDIATLWLQQQELKDNVNEINVWREYLRDYFTNLAIQQEEMMKKSIEDALLKYDADKIGLYDYAAIYACGSIICTPETIPYPANKTISFFKIVNVDVMSSPEAILQPENYPGNCFAFHGSYGRIKIKLGKKIHVRSVTMDHVKYTDDNTSAPKDFEVYGFNGFTDSDLPDILLGRFTYNITGKPQQTFEIHHNYTHLLLDKVELRILSNYGKHEYTCVYRFRVHDKAVRGKRTCERCNKKPEEKNKTVKIN